MGQKRKKKVFPLAKLQMTCLIIVCRESGVRRSVLIRVYNGLCDQQPKHDDERHEQEQAGQELFIHVLRGPGSRWESRKEGDS